MRLGGLCGLALLVKISIQTNTLEYLDLNQLAFKYDIRHVLNPEIQRAVAIVHEDHSSLPQRADVTRQGWARR